MSVTMKERDNEKDRKKKIVCYRKMPLDQKVKLRFDVRKFKNSRNILAI